MVRSGMDLVRKTLRLLAFALLVALLNLFQAVDIHFRCSNAQRPSGEMLTAGQRPLLSANGSPRFRAGLREPASATKY